MLFRGISVSDTDFQRMVRFIQNNYGVDLSRRKQLITSHPSHPLRERGYPDFSAFLDHPLRKQDPADLELALNKLTTNYTFLMWEPDHFTFFRDVILPELSHRHQKNRVLSVWSAGCSSGEEPYTLSIYLKELFGPQASQWDARTLATDISQQVLSKARAGQYELPADMPGEWLKCYLVEGDTTCFYTAAPQLKQNVIFHTFNLMDPIHFRLKFDVTFCRNVMICFDQATRDALVWRLYDALHPTGYLSISHSEPLGRARPFRTAVPMVYQKPPLGTRRQVSQRKVPVLMQTTNRRIRALVVDDPAAAHGIIIRGLSTSPRIEMTECVADTIDAKTKLQHLSPDVITLDMGMPGISGIDFLEQLLLSRPFPVILVSSLNLRIFDALAAGAVDFVRKPDMVESQESFLQALIHKTIAAFHARLSRVNLPHLTAPAAPLHLGGDGAPEQTVIGLGASTGGAEVTSNVLRWLPADIPGIVTVQHMPVGFTKIYAECLNRLCRAEVRETVNSDEIRPGLAFVAPADCQAKVMRMGPRYTFSCILGEKVSGHRSSADVLFSSMAALTCYRMVGIIMVGMGRNGAGGLLKMRKAEAYTIDQDKDSCVVYGTPIVAHDVGAVTVQTSYNNTAGILMNHLNNH